MTYIERIQQAETPEGRHQAMRIAFRAALDKAYAEHDLNIAAIERTFREIIKSRCPGITDDEVLEVTRGNVLVLS